MADNTHLIITVHGIRTYGDWQDELKKLLEAAEPGVTVRMFRYGVFSSLAFLVPPIRWLMGRQFRMFFDQEIRSAPPGARIDLVAHSFGTYLAASALRHLPEGRRIHSVIFAGSVLPPSFPWYKYLQSGAVGRVINECGWNDSVLVLCQSTALLMGMAGRIGFHGMVGNSFINRYYLGGHGVYFDGEQRFMREKWLPILTGDGPVPAHDERPRLTAVGGFNLFVLNNMHLIKIVGACLLLMLAIFIPLDWYRTAARDKQLESFNRIVLLTNAQEIARRDPRHVTDLLLLDAKAIGDERAFERLSAAQRVSNGLSVDDRDEDPDPQWWQFWKRLTGMSFREREAYKARMAHHRANRELVSGNEGLDNKRAMAQADYEAAVKSYEKVKDVASIHGSYALCLIDYGQLLADRGLHDQAVTLFKKARVGVFPRDANGNFTTRPNSLAVESLVLEAESYKVGKNWDVAMQRLKEAIALADESGDQALRCDAYRARGWYHMERLEADFAVRDFAKAKDAAEQVDDTQLVYRVQLFWIRHGLALADRLMGRSRDAYDKFDRIVTDLEELMRRDLTHTPKQRRDLHERLVNSMERRADVLLFARDDPDMSGADGVQAIQDSTAKSIDNLAKMENDFQQAIKTAGNDDLVIKVRLLYKKVIARFLAEVETAWRVPPLQGDVRRETFDEPIYIEFDEANSTLDTLAVDLRKDLKTYHDIAAACVAIRRSASRPRASLPDGKAATLAIFGKPTVKPRPMGYFNRKAIDTLRSLTIEYAKACEQLPREKVEMLLLALEILLKDGIATDAESQTADSRRLLAVLGATTKVTSHPELEPYVDRFTLIASKQPGNPAGVLASDSSPLRYFEAMTEIDAVPEIVRYSLRLGPLLELTVTTQRFEPQAAPPAGNVAPRQTEALTKSR